MNADDESDLEAEFARREAEFVKVFHEIKRDETGLWLIPEWVLDRLGIPTDRGYKVFEEEFTALIEIVTRHTRGKK